MVIHRGTGGAWLFFMPQVQYILRLADNNPWWNGNPGAWLPQADYLVIPVLLTIAGLGVFGRRSGHPESRMGYVLVAQAWTAFAILCFFQFVRRQTALDHDYLAFVAYFHAFPCTAAALASEGRTEGRRARLVTAAVAAVIMLGTLMLLLPTPLPRLMSGMSEATGLARLPPAGPPLVVGLLGVLVMLLMRGPARLVMFAFWFSVVNAWIAPSPNAYGIGTRGSNRQIVALIREADRFTAELDPTLSGIKYWFPGEEATPPPGAIRMDWFFDSFVSTRGWQASLLAESSPGLPIEQLTVTHASQGACIGLLSSVARHDTLRQELSAHFERLGHPVRAVASGRFERPAISFALTVFKPVSGVDALPPCYPVPRLR
jgi:hypothetical protein